MKFILGVFVGAALMLGSAFRARHRHDAAPGRTQPFVNCDTVVGMLGR